MPIDNKLIDNLLKDYKTPEEILGEGGLLKQLTKAVLERAMQAELTAHLGYERYEVSGDNSGNSRNGKSKKTLKGDFGNLPIDVPRDRDSSFEPQIVPKGQTRFSGFDDKILSLYARGMTTREIQRHLEDIYTLSAARWWYANFMERYVCRFWVLVRYAAICPFLLLVLFSPPAAASPDSRFDVWTTDNGLPQNSIYSIIQTHDGYIWFTTFGGLVRYDGVRFTVFDKASAPGLSSSRFTSLFEDAAGTLWAGTEKDGVVKYSGRGFITYTTNDGLPSNKIRVIGGGANGDVWAYTDGGIARWDGAHFVSSETKMPKTDATRAILMMRERNTGFAFYDAKGLHRFVDGQLRTYTASDGLPRVSLNALYEDQRGTLWVETSDRRLYRLQDERLVASPVSGYAPPGAGEMTLAYEDRRGDTWVATRKGSLCRWRDGKLRTYATQDGLSSNQVETIFEDKEGNLWFGTFNNGLNRFREEIFTVYSSAQGLSNPNVYPILEDRMGGVWVGTWGGGVNFFREGRFTSVPLNHSSFAGINENIIGALYEDMDGSLWVGTFDSSIIHFHGGRITRYSTQDGTDHNNVRVIHRDRMGNLWVGTTGGLLLFRDGHFTPCQTEQGLPYREVNAIIEDRGGALWIGTLAGVTRYQNGKFSSYTDRDGLLSNNVRALYEDGDGVIWVGTYDGGLNRYQDGRFTSYTVRDGLFDNSVSQILEDGQGNFWMSCNRGIYRVSRAELNEFAAGRRHSVTSIYYGKRDGLFSIECNGGAQPAGLRSRDGRLWFPTQDGVAVVDPNSVQRSTEPPPVALEEFTIGERVVKFLKEAKIPAGEEQFSIHYTGLSFINPEQMKFKYRLEGLDKDWVDAGSRRTAYYSHVPPGSYTFRVMAANSDGVWNERGASIRINVVPRFYRTWWFLTLVVAAIAGVVALAYRRRVARLERRRSKQEAFARALIASQENERKRIAAELHDSLGQNLLVIKNRALMALKSPEDPAGAMHQVTEISATAAQAIQEVREIAYNLRPYQLDRLGLTKAVEGMIRKVASASTVKFSTDLASMDKLFSEDDEINLFRVFQESINNVVKHSGASVASVSAARSGRTLRVAVADDGRGFAPEAQQSELGDGGGGLGLRGIRERVRILGGDYSIRSAPGQGTTITILFDLRGAQDGYRD